MAKEVKKKLDFNQLAKSIVEQATGEVKEKSASVPKGEGKKKTGDNK